MRPKILASLHAIHLTRHAKIIRNPSQAYPISAHRFQVWFVYKKNLMIKKKKILNDAIVKRKLRETI